MRTQEEIVERIHEVKTSDWMGTQVDDLLDFLTFESAKEFLKPEATKDKWEILELTKDFVLDAMRKYMDFAWEKCLGHRGISASRSLDHFRAWIWLLGDDQVLKDMEETEYAQYGAPQLRMLCEHYGFIWPEGVVAAQRMSVGKRCGTDYECGCET